MIVSRSMLVGTLQNTVYKVITSPISILALGILGTEIGIKAIQNHDKEIRAAVLDLSNSGKCPEAIRKATEIVFGKDQVLNKIVEKCHLAEDRELAAAQMSGGYADKIFKDLIEEKLNGKNCSGAFSIVEKLQDHHQKQFHYFELANRCIEGDLRILAIDKLEPSERRDFAYHQLVEDRLYQNDCSNILETLLKIKSLRLRDPLGSIVRTECTELNDVNNLGKGETAEHWKRIKDHLRQNDCKKALELNGKFHSVHGQMLPAIANKCQDTLAIEDAADAEYLPSLRNFIYQKTLSARLNQNDCDGAAASANKIMDPAMRRLAIQKVSRNCRG